MDEKTRRILTELVNIPGHPDCARRADKFLAERGPLHPKRPKRIDVLQAAGIFRTVWGVKNNRVEVGVLERFLETLFNLPFEGPYARPAMHLSFIAGRWEPSPRCLIESLAVELVRSRKLLARCERQDCDGNRYFVREHSRARYCSDLCRDVIRERCQKHWAQHHREEINARRRKPRQRNAA
jgi:hypothetical protein